MDIRDKFFVETGFCVVEYPEARTTGKEQDARFANIRFPNKCYLAFACEVSTLGTCQIGYNVDTLVSVAI